MRIASSPVSSLSTRQMLSVLPNSRGLRTRVSLSSVSKNLGLPNYDEVLSVKLRTLLQGTCSRRISSGLRVREPFVKGIRIGKEFQADVPDWSGPTMSDTSFVGEPLEIDPSEYMHDLKNGKKPRSAVNWLQCREEDTNRDICGKWLALVTDSTWESLVLKAEESVLVDLWAPWCGPCKMIDPVVNELAKQYARKIKFYKLNTYVSPATPSQYGVRSIPTIIKPIESLQCLLGS